MSKLLKPITEYTTEELLKYIEENNQSTINIESNDVLDFISSYNIKSGIYKVTSQLLFKVYNTWSYNSVQIKKFNREMQDFFPVIDGFYSINKDPMELKKIITNTKHSYSKLPKWQSHFQDFLAKYSIKSDKKTGQHVIDEVLYNLYDKWTYKNKNKNPLDYILFNKFCRVYLPCYKYISRQHWYKLDKAILPHLSETLLNPMMKKKKKKNIS